MFKNQCKENKDIFGKLIWILKQARTFSKELKLF